MALLLRKHFSKRSDMAGLDNSKNQQLCKQKLPQLQLLSSIEPLNKLHVISAIPPSKKLLLPDVVTEPTTVLDSCGYFSWAVRKPWLGFSKDQDYASNQ